MDKMKDLKLITKDSLVSNDDLRDIKKNLMKEIFRLKNINNEIEYKDPRSSINLPYDHNLLEKINKAIEEKKELNPSYLIVVGIGGSNLGAMAVQEAVLGKLYNQLNPKTKVLYADTVDSDLINDIISIIEPALKNGENVLINGISKSGGTTETVANFEILIDLLKKYKKDYNKYVIVTSDKDSKFWNFAANEGFTTLEIPNEVVGRYSVLSAVGLFPLGIMGINIKNLIQGAKDITQRCIDENIEKNPAAISASLIFMHYKDKKNIHNTFLFSPDMESIGKWYNQLMGESIGKEFNLKDEPVRVGITPTVSIGSTDLHSMVQLYLAGPNDKLTTFVKVRNNKTEIKIPNNEDYSKLVKGIQEKKLQSIMDAIYEGVIKAYRNRKRAFIEIHLDDKTEYSIGQFIQFKMIEIMYLGYLFEINPFNQPNVEEYKTETKIILEKE